MKLSTKLADPITHYLVTFSGIHIGMTTPQYDAFVQASCGESRGMKVNGNYVAFGDVASIPSAELYFETYPDRRPMQSTGVSLPPVGMGGIIRMATPKFLEIFITHWREQIPRRLMETGREQNNLKKLLKHAEDRYYAITGARI